MFKVGDKVRNTSDDDYGLTIGKTYVITDDSDQYGSGPNQAVMFKDDEGDLRRRNGADYELIPEPIQPCQCDTQFADAERYTFSYTLETEGEIDCVTKSLEGDTAGDLSAVLCAFRDFLSRSGFDYVVEVSAVTDDGQWFSSNTEVV